jgi:hypothetical protein
MYRSVAIVVCLCAVARFVQATPEERGDFTIDLWVSPGGSVYVVAYTRLFTPPYAMNTLLMRYLDNGIRTDFHKLPGAFSSYTLAGMLVPAPDKRSFYIVCDDEDSVMVARYTLPFRQEWRQTYRLPEAYFERSERAACDNEGSLYVASLVNLRGTGPFSTSRGCRLAKFNAKGETVFTYVAEGYFRDLLVTPKGQAYLLLENQLLCLSPDGKLLWKREFVSKVPSDANLFAIPGGIAVGDVAFGADTARLRVFDHNGRLTTTKRVPIPYYHNGAGVFYSCKVVPRKATYQLRVFAYDLSGRRLWQASTTARPKQGEDPLFEEEKKPILVRDGGGNVYLIINLPPLTVVKWDSRGTLKYQRQFYPLGRDAALVRKAQLDSQGNLYVALSATKGGPDYDSVVFKTSPTGRLLWVGLYDSRQYIKRK